MQRLDQLRTVIVYLLNMSEFSTLSIPYRNSPQNVHVSSITKSLLCQFTKDSSWFFKLPPNFFVVKNLCTKAPMYYSSRLNALTGSRLSNKENNLRMYLREHVPTQDWQTDLATFMIVQLVNLFIRANFCVLLPPFKLIIRLVLWAS